MKLYYVSKKGVYTQGVYGIFDNFDLAKAAMAEAIELEYDNISSTEGVSK